MSRLARATVRAAAFSLSITAASSLAADSSANAISRLGIFTHPAMYTEFQFQIYAREQDPGTDDVRKIADEIFLEIDDLEQRISTWIPASNASQVNARAAQEPVRVGGDLYRILDLAKSMHKKTGGAFDVTVGPLLEVYGFYKKQASTPSKEAIAEVLPRIGMDKVTLDPADNSVRFSQPGVRVDFGGIGKGYALDIAAQRLRGFGVTRALLSGGTSSLVAIGAPPGRDGWTAGIRNPYNSSEQLGFITFADEALATSACYGKGGPAAQDSPCDILDPRTGYPANQGVLSVTVVGNISGAEADALSTAFVVMGRDRIEEYVQAHPGLRVVLIEAPYSEGTKPIYIGFPKTEEHEK